MIYDVIDDGVQGGVSKFKISVIYVNLVFEFLVCVYEVNYVDNYYRGLVSQKINYNYKENIGNFYFVYGQKIIIVMVELFLFLIELKVEVMFLNGEEYFGVISYDDN